MKIYRHTGPGHYIGSCIVVVANCLNEAEAHISALLRKNGLKDEKLNIEELEIYAGKKVVEINGDY